MADDEQGLAFENECSEGAAQVHHYVDPPDFKAENDMHRRGCSYCDAAMVHIPRIDQFLAKKNYEAIFHRPCTQRSKHPDEGLLCPHCRHLSPRHLFNRHAAGCLPVIYRLFSLGSTVEVVERARNFSQCPLCNLVAAVVRRSLGHTLSMAIAVVMELDDSFIDFCQNIQVKLLLPHTAPNHRSFARRVTLEGVLVVSETNIAVHDRSSLPTSHWLRGMAGTIYEGASPRVFTSAAPLQGPMTMQRVDWPSIRRFICECENRHADCVPAGAGVFPAAFRVVDVQERRVVRGCPSGRFVALSYVWGTRGPSDKLAAKKSSIEYLERVGSLRDADLPTTIADAMEACRMLGERYIWVDSLCIVQDDFDEKQEQIDSIAEVYKSAAFTMIIATGRSMHDSIPGISVDRPGRVYANMLGMSFVEIEKWDPSVETSPAKLVRNSEWSKRGWTYQERVLPIRKLYFSDNDVFFQCSVSVKYDHLMEVVDCQKNTSHEGLSDSLDSLSTCSDKFLHFERHLDSYLKLSLTHDSDTLNAFAGILQTLVGDGSGPMFGLPPPALDLALLWVPSRDKTNNPLHLDVRNIPNMTIPSWSWASIQGYRNISFPRQFAGTLVTWFRLDKTQTSLHRIDAAPAQWKSNRTASWNSALLKKWMEDGFGHQAELYMALAWWAGCCEWTVPTDEHRLYIPARFSDLEHAAARRWPSYEDYLREMVARAVAPVRHHQQLRKMVTPHCRENTSATAGGLCEVLWCRAQSALFNVTKAAEDGRLVIEDEERQYIGTFSVKEGEPNMKHVLLRLEAGEDRVKCEFIALSVFARYTWKEYVEWASHMPELWTYWTDDMISMPENGLTFFDCEGNHLQNPAMVSVMAIGRDEDGFAFRMGLGEIFLTKWAKAERRFTDIALR